MSAYSAMMTFKRHLKTGKSSKVISTPVAGSVRLNFSVNDDVLLSFPLVQHREKSRAGSKPSVLYVAVLAFGSFFYTMGGLGVF